MSNDTCFFGHTWHLQAFSTCLRCGKQYDDTRILHKLVKFFGGSYESQYSMTKYFYPSIFYRWGKEIKHRTNKIRKRTRWAIEGFIIKIILYVRKY